MSICLNYGYEGTIAYQNHQSAIVGKPQCVYEFIYLASCTERERRRRRQKVDGEKGINASCFAQSVMIDDFSHLL